MHLKLPAAILLISLTAGTVPVFAESADLVVFVTGVDCDKNRCCITKGNAYHTEVTCTARSEDDDAKPTPSLTVHRKGVFNG